MIVKKNITGRVTAVAILAAALAFHAWQSGAEEPQAGDFMPQPVTVAAREDMSLPTAGFSEWIGTWPTEEPVSSSANDIPQAGAALDVKTVADEDSPGVSEPGKMDVNGCEDAAEETSLDDAGDEGLDEPNGAGDGIKSKEEDEPATNMTTQEPTASQDDVRLLARLIYAEVGSVKDDACLYATGSVVLNRIADPDFPSTLWGVIYQDEPSVQYQCTVDGHIDWEPDGRCLTIAEDLLKNGGTIPTDVVYQSSHIMGSGSYESFGNVVFSHK